VTYGSELASYGFGDGHPFGPDRLDAFWNYLQKEGLESQIHIAQPSTTDKNIIGRFHTDDYISRVQEQSLTGDGYLDCGDTPAFKGVFEAASIVAGSTVSAVDNLMLGHCHRAFVPIAGLHHARRDSAAGFCVFNDCGIAIEHLRNQYDIQHVAYRYLYPGTGRETETGRGQAENTKLNIPAPPDAGDEFFFQAWEQLEAFVRKGQPEFIILQCGADSIAGDPITHLRFTPAAHAHAASRLCQLADEFSNGRLLALGGGGYNRNNLARAWTAVVSSMIETE